MADTTVQPETRSTICELYCYRKGDEEFETALQSASDADITFRSRDNVLFGIHRRNLETSTGGFPPGEFSAGGEEEVVLLSEDAETLEVLFQFVYPRYHPTLRETAFPLLAAVAEAAEKYQVFAAVNICNVRMEQALPQHAVQVLNYAMKHGYMDLVREAVPRMLDIPMESVVQELADNLVVPWVIFRQRWSNAVLKFIWSPFGPSCKYGCINSVIGDMWQKLGEKRSRGAVLSAYEGMKQPCSHVVIDMRKESARLDGVLERMPAFGK